MEDNLNECTTGILIDLEDQENIAAEEKSWIMIKNDVESSSDEFHYLCKHNEHGEKESYNSSEESQCITDKFNSIHLRAATKKEKLSNSRGGWKTPSPQSMNIIWKEASKIIDKLHSSPIESTEVLLVDEEFPVSFPFQKHSDDLSAASAQISEKNENSLKDGDVPPTLILKSDISELKIKEVSFPEKVTVEDKKSKSIPVQIMSAENLPEEESHVANLLLNTVILDAEISENADTQIEDSIKSTAMFKDPKYNSEEKKSKNFLGKTLKTPLRSIKINKVKASEEKPQVNADRHPTLVSEPKISKSADIEKINCFPKSITAGTKLSKPISIQMKSKNVYGSALKTPIKICEINNENATEEKSNIDEDVLPAMVLGSEISESSDRQTKDHFSKNITASKDSKLLSIPMKPNNFNRNALRTPIRNKENAITKKGISSGVKVPKSEKDVLKNVLGESNTNCIGKLQFVTKVEHFSKENHAAVIPEKMNSKANKSILHNLIGSNKKSSIAAPRTSNAIHYQQGSQQKQALCKTKSAVETPSYPKFVRRSSSFQSENRSYSVTKRLLKTCSEQEYMSGMNSLGNIASKPESSTKLLKPRMSMGPTQSAGFGLSTPLRRSNSLSKKSGVFSSQISRLNTTHNASSVAENAPQLSLLKRPVLSTSSRNRFCSRLDLPSSLPPSMNDNLSRKLFPDLKLPLRR